ncbi:MAG: hypothetical protein ACYC3I_06620 [Gemmataceae bacterium]
MTTPTEPPTIQPAEREWAVPEALEIGRYTALTANWKFSKDKIAEIRAALAAANLPGVIVTLAVAGSLGRMDAAEVSDCDLLVVLTDAALQDAAGAQQVYDAVWQALAPLHLNAPKPTGTFSQPTSVEQLCDKKNIGAASEDMRTFAKRLLLLLETQPVYKPDGYQQVVSAVVKSYAEDYVAQDPRKEWGFLINDLIRYFRSICVNYQWDFENEHGKWPLRNIKLRHSRLIMYGGLLMLLGECRRERENKVEWLRKRLVLTPLERIAWVYSANQDTSFFRIAGSYDTFLGMLSKAEVRDELNGPQVQPGSYATRYQMRNYAILKANSDGLVAELLRFVLARRGTWSERFFEYLIF